MKGIKNVAVGEIRAYCILNVDYKCLSIGVSY